MRTRVKRSGSEDEESNLIVNDHNTSKFADSLQNSNDQASRPKSNQRRILFLIICAGLALLLISTGLVESFIEPEEFSSSSIDESDYFTIVINTYLRHDMLIDALDHYSQCPHAKYIHVVWSESQSVPATFDKYMDTGIIFDIHTIDSLNNRFKPLSTPHTHGIFAVDDDMRVSCYDLNFAFSVWKSSSSSLIGFLPRIHAQSAYNSKLWVYRCWGKVWWSGEYSIILTKAAFLHHDYLIAYSAFDEIATREKKVRQYVDDHMNCEDIAMQFLVSYMSSLPPVLVQGSLTDLGVLNGISTHSNVIEAKHMDSRSACINDLVEIYDGRMPLKMSSVVVRNGLNNYFDLEPSTWWEVISSDLWNFY